MKLFTWYEYRKWRWLFPYKIDNEYLYLLSYNSSNDKLRAVVFDRDDNTILKVKEINIDNIDKIYKEEIIIQIWEVDFNES